MGSVAMSILGMGNPLLDISSEVPPEMLEKYGLKLNDAILAEEKHQPLFDEMVKLPSVQFIAGGATQNSIRVAQWMLQAKGGTAYMGCIGDDANGKKMIDACAKDGVTTAYMVDKSTPTGCCAVLINTPERSLCTNLNAANNFKVEHLKKPENWAICEAAKVIYSAGFFITVCPDAMRAACAEAAKREAIYCMNLSAPFLMMVPPFKAVFVELMSQADFLFGNETEAQTWADSEGWDTKDVEFIAMRLSLIPSTKKEKLIDTNGAGDAYVGGFLAALSKGLDMAACCKAGAYAASVIVQHSGCTYPAKPDYTF